MKNKKIFIALLLLIVSILFFNNKAQAALNTSRRDIVFNCKFYADSYEDLKVAYGYNYNQLYNHFLNYGLEEGRCASPVFKIYDYIHFNHDVADAFTVPSEDLNTENISFKNVYEHFLNYGIREGRRSSTVFDVNYYLASYGDLKRAFGNDYFAAYLHFLNYGINEGRRASVRFDVQYYLSNYGDLRDAFGYDYNKAISHYMNYGIYEGRRGTSLPPESPGW